MSPEERRAVVALAGIYALRLLGLFMVLPVFAIYATEYTGYSPQLAGLAIGVYGLAQAALQIPFGMLSDRFGRKPVITAGLFVFVVGSVVAAATDDMIGLLIGRALQGAGAVAAAVMALTADLTRDENRTKAMAGIGASIGLSFGVAMVLGPLTASKAGLAGVFWLTAVLAATSILVLHLAVPTPREARRSRDVSPAWAQLGQVLGERELVRLDVGIFLLHATITALFVVLPLELRDTGGIAAEDQWQVFLGIMVGGLALMIPCIIAAERHGHVRVVFLGAIAVLGVSSIAVDWSGGLWPLLAAALAFFTAINLLEALLPSLVSRIAPVDMKGTALGVYSTSQFLGAFCGGTAAGWLHGEIGTAGVLMAACALCAVWFVVAWSMVPPLQVSRRIVPVGEVDAAEADRLLARLRAVPGVREAAVVADEGLAYLKVDQKTLDEQALEAARGMA